MIWDKFSLIFSFLQINVLFSNSVFVFTSEIPPTAMMVDHVPLTVQILSMFPSVPPRFHCSLLISVPYVVASSLCLVITIEY